MFSVFSFAMTSSADVANSSGGHLPQGRAIHTYPLWDMPFTGIGCIKAWNHCTVYASEYLVSAAQPCRHVSALLKISLK